jgi:hypothetical protein
MPPLRGWILGRFLFTELWGISVLMHRPKPLIQAAEMAPTGSRAFQRITNLKVN